MEVVSCGRAHPPGIVCLFEVKVARGSAGARRLLPAAVLVEGLSVRAGDDGNSDAEQEKNDESVSHYWHAESFVRVAVRARAALREFVSSTASPCDQLFAVMQIQLMDEASVPDDEVTVRAVALGMILYVFPVVLGPREQDGAAE